MSHGTPCPCCLYAHWAECKGNFRLVMDKYSLDTECFRAVGESALAFGQWGSPDALLATRDLLVGHRWIQFWLVLQEVAQIGSVYGQLTF